MPTPMSSRGRLLAELYRRGVVLTTLGNTIKADPPEQDTPDLRAMIEEHKAWLKEQLTLPYDHDWVLDASQSIIRRAAEKLGDRPLSAEAAKALDDLDRAAVEGSRIGVLAALAGFEAAIEDLQVAVTMVQDGGSIA